MQQGYQLQRWLQPMGSLLECRRSNQRWLRGAGQMQSRVRIY